MTARDDLETECGPIYFGCPPGSCRGRGHRFIDVHGRTLVSLNGEGLAMPWSHIDGRMVTPRTGFQGRGREGEAVLHHRDGWTAIAWHDHRGDSRPNSNSAVFLPLPDLDFDAAVVHARQAFPRFVPDALRDRTDLFDCGEL